MWDTPSVIFALSPSKAGLPVKKGSMSTALPAKSSRKAEWPNHVIFMEASLVFGSMKWSELGIPTMFQRNKTAGSGFKKLSNKHQACRRIAMPRLIASLSLAAGLLASTSAWAVEISISCSALGKEYEICKQGVDAWAKKTGNTVKIVSTPNSATERLALYQQLLAAGAADIDVFQIDVVWTGILADHLIDLTAKAPGRHRRSPARHGRNEPRQRQAHGHALVRRCGPALLPHRTSSRNTSAPCRRPGPT